MDADGPCFLWIIVREPSDWITAGGTKIRAAHAVYFNNIRNALMDCRVLPQSMKEARSHTWAGEDWNRCLATMNNSVIGGMLVQPDFIPDVFAWVSSEQRDLLDYYRVTGYDKMPIFVTNVLRVFVTERPNIVGFAGGQRQRGMWSVLSPWMSDSLLDCLDPQGRRIRDIIQGWCAEFGVENFPGLKERRACSIMGAHAALLLGQNWTSWGFPVTQNKRRRGGMRLDLARDITRKIDLPADDISHVLEVEDLNPSNDFRPENLQHIADTFRLLLSRQGAVGDVLKQEATQHIKWLQSIRNTIVTQQYLFGRRAYDISLLLHALMASAHLRTTKSLWEVVRHCLYIAVHDARLRAHFLEQIESQKVVPSQTTLVRNRITLHIGFCRLLSLQHGDIIDADCGFVRWATMDESPQGHFAWMMHGGIAMRIDRMLAVFRQAQRLSNSKSLGLTAAVQSQIVNDIASDLLLTQGVPTALGSGRCSLRHKMAAVTHSCRLQLSSWKDSVRWINSTFCWTGDLGVESGVSFFVDDARGLLGSWIEASDIGPAEVHADDPGDDFDFQPEGYEVHNAHDDSPPPLAPPMETRAYMIDCRSSIYIPGLMHIVHNGTSDLESILPFWSSYVCQLKAVCKLISKRKYCDRLIETCFNSPPQNAYTGDLREFTHHVYDGRWGSVLAAVAALIPLEDPLVYGWSAQKYRFGEVQERGGDQGAETAQVGLVNTAITSNLFWSYCRMLDYIGEALLHFVVWCEACPCHEKDLHLAGPSRHMRKQAFRKLVDDDTCPLRCMRAPELAMGAASTHLATLLRKANSEFLMNPQVLRLSEQDRAIVLRDFEAARRHLSFTFAIKLSFWSQCPWLCFGLAHHDIEQARRCARLILQYRTRIADWKREHIVIRTLLLKPELRDQLIDFAQGSSSLEAFPSLEQFACRFRFGFASERWIESRHALLKKVFSNASNAGSAHIAFHSIMQPLRRMLQLSPESFINLTRCCRSTTNVYACIRETGLEQHPTVSTMLKQHGGRKSELHGKDRKHLVQVLYHTDPKSLFRDMPAKHIVCYDDDPPDRGPPPAPPAAGPDTGDQPPHCDDEAPPPHSPQDMRPGDSPPPLCPPPPHWPPPSPSQGDIHKRGAAVQPDEDARAMDHDDERAQCAPADDAYEVCMRRCLFDFLHELASAWQVNGDSLSSHILSIHVSDGAVVPWQRITTLLAPFRAQTSAPEVSVQNLFDFNLEIGRGGGGLAIDKLPPALPDRDPRFCNRICSFSIAHLSPGSKHVVKGATKIQRGDNIGIHILNIVEMKQPYIRVALDAGDRGEESMCVCVDTIFVQRPEVGQGIVALESFACFVL